MPGIVPKGQAITDLVYLHKKVNEEELFENGDDAKIYKELERCLEASEQYATDKDTVIFASATIKRILIIINNSAKQSLPLHFYNKLILYIKRVWDYTADVVCHEAVDIFTLILNIHQKQCSYCLERRPEDNAANCDWIYEMVQWLLDPMIVNRSRYKCLLQLVTACPSLSDNLTPDFFNRAYPNLTNATLANVICELIIVNLSDNESWHFHSTAIKEFAYKNPNSVIKNRLIHLIEKKANLRPFLEVLLDELSREQSQIEAGDLELILEISRALIYTQKTSEKKKTKNKKYELENVISWVDLIPHSVMMDAIIHVNPEVGVSAWKLIVDHPKRTFPLTENDIDLMKLFLDANMSIQSSSARQTILATLKIALLRFSEISEQALKHKSNENWQMAGGDYMEEYEEDSVPANVKMYMDFVKRVAMMAFDSLSPLANFYRRFMALQMIDCLYNRANYIVNGKTQFVDRLRLDATLGSDRHKMVLACLDDSYDLCQTIALKILKTVDFGHVDIDEESYLCESTGLMASSKTRNTSASGYRMQYLMSRHPDRLKGLLEKFATDCSKFTELAEKELMNITCHSVHPLLNTIESLLQNAKIDDDSKWWSVFIGDKLLPMCYRIVKVVTPVVHNLSPEGYIPEEKLADLGNASTNQHAELSQQLLVCCWRAHKHISSIFSWCIRTLAPSGLLSAENVRQIGSFYWTQLTECKHRGAFECAIDGFNDMCRLLWSCENPDYPRPMDWLDEILSAIDGKKDLSNLCSTRRSAGLPHLVVGIVATEPNGTTALTKAVESLLEMEHKSEKYRIHSLNVMKAIVLASSLSEKITFALQHTLYVAINGCRAEWSERNAASQLFAALRTRIFGVSRSVQRTLTVDAKNRKSSYEFFAKFPLLYEFIYNQLHNTEHSEFSLLPPLVLLTHLNSPPSSSHVYPLAPFVPQLLKIALIDRRENIRSHAVAAILAIADLNVKIDLCTWIEEFEFANARQNHIHSVLSLISGLAEHAEYAHRLLNVVEKCFKMGYFKKWCDYNLNILLMFANRMNIDYDVDEIAMDRITLTKRPIAYKLLISQDVLKTELGGWLNDAEIRMEAYRFIGKLSWNVCNKYLCACIIDWASKDLARDDLPQCDAKIIMDILSRGDELINDKIREDLRSTVLRKLNDPDSTWTLHSTRSAAMQIKYMRRAEENQQIDEELVEWIRNCFDSEDYEAKETALHTAFRLTMQLEPNMSLSPNFYKEIEIELIEAVSLYLQDDDIEIRKKASQHLSHLVNCSTRTALNPAVCRLLLSKWIIGDRSSNEETEEWENSPNMEKPDRDEIFDACAVNQYAERAQFSDIRLYEALMQRMSGPCDVFELEMD